MEIKVPSEIESSLDLDSREGAPVIVHAPSAQNVHGAVEWLHAHRSALRAALLHHGHVLIRGLPIADQNDFSRVREVLIDKAAEYREKATPRSDYGNAVFSSTNFPASESIKLHNENSYTMDFPGTVLFCCLEAPSERGATTIADVRKVLRNVSESLRERFRQSGWMLVRNYREYVGLPWRVAFGSDSREDVERYCERNLIAAQWESGDVLRTRQLRSAIIAHPVTGEEVWFNHVAFWSKWSLDDEVRKMLIETFGEKGLPFDTLLGDGSGLGREEIEELKHAYELATCRESWKRGDVMIVDNILCAHGRDPFVGQRKVVVSMGNAVSLESCKPTISLDDMKMKIASAP